MKTNKIINNKKKILKNYLKMRIIMKKSNSHKKRCSKK